LHPHEFSSGAIGIGQSFLQAIGVHAAAAGSLLIIAAGFL
jgi:hypothetical protein